MFKLTPHRRPAKLFNNIKHSNNLDRPPAHTVSRDGNLTQPSLWSHGCAPSRQHGAQEGAEDETEEGVLQVQTEFEAEEAGGETALPLYQSCILSF